MSVQDDLASFHSTVSAGDTYLGGGEYDNAIQSYQAAGQAGATTLGPEIDQYTAGASKSITQTAWKMNGSLQQLPSSGATQAEATEAQSIAQQMGQMYDQAISLQQPLPPPPAPGGGGGGGVVPGGGGGGPLANAGGGLPRWLKFVLGAIAVGGLGLLGWALFFRGKHGMTLSAAESGRRRRRGGKRAGKRRSRRGKKRGSRR